MKGEVYNRRPEFIDIVNDTSPQLGGFLDANGNYIQLEKGGDIASADPLVIDTDGDYFDVTGTTNFASMTVAADRHFFTQFDGILTMTHHATNLDLPGEANITTAAGDVAEWVSTGANTVQCVGYTKADGKAVVETAGLANIVEDTSPQLGGDLEYNEKHIIFKTTLTSDDTASGDIITVTFGESVVFGKLCYPDPTEDEWMLALGTNVAVKHPAMGVALETKANGAAGKLLLRGLIRDATYFSAFALGDILYLSDGTAGSWLNAAPGDSGDIVQVVGWVLAANYAFFNPCYTYVEVA